MSTTIPPSLKAITPYIQRANELEEKAPIVSYYCLNLFLFKFGKAEVMLWNLEFLLEKTKNHKNSIFFNFLNFSLIGMMDKLEQDKKKLQPNPDEGKAVVEIFALKMFKKADDGDRAGNYTASVRMID
jgi:vacuolar protein sorting-associated protein VTA1